MKYELNRRMMKEGVGLYDVFCTSGDSTPRQKLLSKHILLIKHSECKDKLITKYIGGYKSLKEIRLDTFKTKKTWG